MPAVVARRAIEPFSVHASVPRSTAVFMRSIRSNPTAQAGVFSYDNVTIYKQVAHSCCLVVDARLIAVVLRDVRKGEPRSCPPMAE